MSPEKRERLWSEAKRCCRLSTEAVRMARELGLNPLSLIKNIPTPKQQWKAPVEEWVRDIYEKRHKAKGKPPARAAKPSAGTEPGAG